MKNFMPLILMTALPVFAEPRDVRRILAENGFKPDARVEGDVIGYPLPSMTAWPIGRPLDGDWRYEFDPLPTVFTVLSGEQTQKLASLLADRMTYNARLGGKLCGGFHADVAIRIPGSEGSLYVLLCFGCNEIRLLKRGVVVASADMDRGRNKLVAFLRSTFPKVKEFRVAPLEDREDDQRDWAKDVVGWAEAVIPDDPILKRVRSLKSEEISEDDLEELDARCNAREREMQEAERKRSESTTTVPGAPVDPFRR